MSMPTLSGTPDKRRRRTRAQIEQLEKQIVDVLREDHPQSIRHVYYRMTNPRLPEPVDKTDNGYSQVQSRITQMRRDGTLPYGWITDATRRGYHVETFGGPAEFISETARFYRRNLWQQAAHYVEVWTESRSIAGIIEDDCRDLCVSMYPAGGFGSITLAYQAADHINYTTMDGLVPAEIIYIGDYDPAGVLIDISLNRELRRHLSDDVTLNFHRLAITEEQIAEFDLPAKPRKETDRRALHIKTTVEAEAMPANILRTMLREKVESFLPADAMNVTRIAEESEREFCSRLPMRFGRLGHDRRRRGYALSHRHMAGPAAGEHIATQAAWRIVYGRLPYRRCLQWLRRAMDRSRLSRSALDLPHGYRARSDRSSDIRP